MIDISTEQASAMKLNHMVPSSPEYGLFMVWLFEHSPVGGVVREM